MFTKLSALYQARLGGVARKGRWCSLQPLCASYWDDWVRGSQMIITHTLHSLSPPGFSSTESASHYRSGYKHCATEVSHYVMSMDSIDHNVRSNILCHLNSCCQSVYMSYPCGTSSPPISPLHQSQAPNDPHHYHFQPVAYPPPPLLVHAHSLTDVTGSDVTHLATGYHSSTRQRPNNIAAPAVETSTVTKETPGTEPVWRPWWLMFAIKTPLMMEIPSIEKPFKTKWMNDHKEEILRLLAIGRKQSISVT